MNNLINLLLLINYLLISKRIIYYYQDDNYHNRIFKILLKEKLKIEIYYYLLLFLLLLIKNIFISILITISLIIIIIKNYKIVKNKKIKQTSRIKRLLIIHILLIIILIKNVNSIMLLNIFSITIHYILGQIANIIEYIIMLKYYKQAKKKIDEYKPIIIGITGSCGKTSIKNYIYDCLKDEYLIYKSPKSYNTLKGLTITINEKLKYYNSIFILEMGLSHKNDIKKIMKYFPPDISIISEILPAHLETMKSVDNIVFEKMNIIKFMKKNGLIIINNDNELIRNNINKYNVNKNKIIKIGFTNINDVYTNDINVKKDGLEFTLVDKNTKEEKMVKSKIIGRHNIYNLLITYCVIKYFNVNTNKINELENTENRLEVKKYNKMVILNDSYNSNIKGFLNALEILSLYNGEKYIITPGIVEGGKLGNEINSIIALKITEICDFCYVIDNKNASFFIKIFNEKNYKKYEIKKDFISAFNDVKDKEIVLLIENDLTDFYYMK